MSLPHPSFIRPDENTMIWHYLDFTKFISLLERQALFFSTIGMLRQSDPHEGTYNSATIEASKQKPFSIHDVGSPTLRQFGKLLAVNCWHMNEIESVAMWNIYLKGNPGVAIQSTFSKLENHLKSHSSHIIEIGKVHYLSEKEIIPEPDGFNGLNAALWKWKSYEYENELRAVLISRLEELYKYNGIYVPVTLDQLIQKIVISPKAPRWVSELILSMASKYGLGDKVSPSRLDVSPGVFDNNEVGIPFTCQACRTEQHISIELFVEKDYPNNSTIVFSAERVTFQCQHCGQTFYFHPEIEVTYPDSDITQTNSG